jgi:ketosteroid isomerase-like protein
MKTVQLSAFFSFFILAMLLSACRATGPLDEAAIKKEVYSEFKASEKAWNEGSIERFMNSYLHSDTLRFAGNDSANYGWETVFERYRTRYPDRAAMGVLTFSDVDITVISEDAALLFGRWRLERAEDEPSGVYTLLFRKTKDGWRIVHDHSSSAPEE